MPKLQSYVLFLIRVSTRYAFSRDARFLSRDTRADDSDCGMGRKCVDGECCSWKRCCKKGYSCQFMKTGFDGDGYDSQFSCKPKYA